MIGRLGLESEQKLKELEKDFPAAGPWEKWLRRKAEQTREFFGGPRTRSFWRGLKSREALAREAKEKADTAAAEAKVTADAGKAEADAAKLKKRQELYRKTRQEYESQPPETYGRERPPPPVPRDPKAQWAEQQQHINWLKLIEPQMNEDDKGNPGNTARRLGYALSLPWLRREWQQKHPPGGYRPWRSGLRLGPGQGLRSWG